MYNPNFPWTKVFKGNTWPTKVWREPCVRCGRDKKELILELLLVYPGSACEYYTILNNTIRCEIFLSLKLQYSEVNLAELKNLKFRSDSYNKLYPNWKEITSKWISKVFKIQKIWMEDLRLKVIEKLEI